MNNSKNKAIEKKKGYADENHKKFWSELSKKKYHNMEVRNIKSKTKEIFNK